MAAIPLLEEMNGGGTSSMIDSLAGYDGDDAVPAIEEQAERRRPARKLAIYAASAGFDLVEELDFLSARSIEPNVFFNPRFLAPAMPRLEDRDVRLAVIRDGDDYRSRLRLLTPFSIEKPPVPFAVPIIRTWSSPFGPLGTPLVDGDDPVGVIEDFFGMLGRPHLGLPSVFVMPEVRLDGPFADMVRDLSETRNLPLTIVNRTERPFLQSTLEPEAYLRNALGNSRFGEFRRVKRRLGEQGVLEHRIARQPNEIRAGIETFLAMEASGWKGRERSAMAVDRYRAAFAREAAYRLAERDFCRVHTLVLDGRPIATLIVFIESGIAYTWKTAYDESYAPFSPGMLLMIEVTRAHLDDPNIVATDSCAVPDHPVVSRLWTETRPLGTLVIGLNTDAGRATHQAASQLHLYKETRNAMRLMRERVRRLIRRN